ncbi:MAG: hypothetical protein GY700_06620 [Propionibacteriaceae bacterium]|nr:hypothetical protein [Propionibacteriaceae bacterium]
MEITPEMQQKMAEAEAQAEEEVPNEIISFKVTGNDGTLLKISLGDKIDKKSVEKIIPTADGIFKVVFTCCLSDGSFEHHPAGRVVSYRLREEEQPLVQSVSSIGENLIMGRE